MFLYMRYTPKALANFSPGLSLRSNPGIKILNNHLTLKGFANRLTPSGFNLFHIAFPGLSLRSNPGLELANAFGVTDNLLLHSLPPTWSFTPNKKVARNLCDP